MVLWPSLHYVMYSIANALCIGFYSLRVHGAITLPDSMLHIKDNVLVNNYTMPVQKVSEYDQEIQQSQTADKPTAP